MHFELRRRPVQSLLPTAVTILVIEDQTMIRELLVIACGQAIPTAEIYAAGTAAAALALCARHKPELIILDLVLPDGDGLDLLPEFFRAAPATKIIALSSHIDEFTLHRAVSSRVHGILDKNEQPVKVLREAIDAVLAGRQYISSRVQRLRAEVRADPVAFNKILSEREQEVLGLIGLGLANAQIAEKLGISLSTAKHHRLNIMSKLDMHSTPQLIRYALDKGFIHVAEGRGLR